MVILGSQETDLLSNPNTINQLHSNLTGQFFIYPVLKLDEIKQKCLNVQ